MVNSSIFRHQKFLYFVPELLYWRDFCQDLSGKEERIKPVDWSLKLQISLRVEYLLYRHIPRL